MPTFTRQRDDFLWLGILFEFSLTISVKICTLWCEWSNSLQNESWSSSFSRWRTSMFLRFDQSKNPLGMREKSIERFFKRFFLCHWMIQFYNNGIKYWRRLWRELTINDRWKLKSLQNGFGSHSAFYLNLKSENYFLTKM